MPSLLRVFLDTLATALVGPLPEDIRRNLRYDILAAAAYGVFYATIISFMPVVLRNLGATSTQLAFYTTSSYFGSLLSLFTVLVMRGPHMLRYALISWIFARGLFVLAFFVDTPEALLVLCAFFWIAEGFPAPAYTQIMQKVYPTELRGRAMAVVRSGMVTVLVITTPLAGWALDAVGYKWTFAVAGVMGIVSALLFARLGQGADLTLPTARRSLADAFAVARHDRPFALFLLAIAVYGVGGLMGLPLYPIVQVSRLGLSYSEIGYLGLAQSLVWALTLPFWGRMLDRRGPLWVIRGAIALNAFVPFSYIWANSGWALLPAFLVQGVVLSAFDLAIANTAIQMSGRERVLEYSALQTTVVGLRGFIAPWVGAAFLALGAPDTLVFATGSALVLLSFVIVSRVRPPERRLTTDGHG